MLRYTFWLGLGALAVVMTLVLPHRPAGTPVDPLRVAVPAPALLALDR